MRQRYVETQSTPQAEFSQRMFRYFARLHEKHNLPVYPIAVFSYDAPLRPEPTRYRVAFPDTTVLECLRLLATLRLNPARTQLISGFIDSYLRLNAQEQQVFNQRLQAVAPQEREATMNIVTSWMEEGLQQESQTIALRIWRRRFGAISESVEVRVRQLSREQGEDLVEALLDLQSISEAEDWLARRSVE